MTFDDDYLFCHFHVIGDQRVPLQMMELAWPPPAYIYVDQGARIREATQDEVDTNDEMVMVRLRHSDITDEQRAGMTHVMRGAEYCYLADEEVWLATLGVDS